jgi:hypothetical protein
MSKTFGRAKPATLYVPSLEHPAGVAMNSDHVKKEQEHE